jgi:hypothetical protein
VTRAALRKMARATSELRLIRTNVNNLHVGVRATLARARRRPGPEQEA